LHKKSQSAKGAEYDSQGQATQERRPWFSQAEFLSPERAE